MILTSLDNSSLFETNFLPHVLVFLSTFLCSKIFFLKKRTKKKSKKS